MGREKNGWNRGSRKAHSTMLRVGRSPIFGGKRGVGRGKWGFFFGFLVLMSILGLRTGILGGGVWTPGF